MVKKEKTQIRNIKNEKVNNRCYSVKRIEPLCCPPETITTLLSGSTPIQDKSSIKRDNKKIINRIMLLFIPSGDMRKGKSDFFFGEGAMTIQRRNDSLMSK